MVSPKGIFVNNESRVKLPMNKPDSCSNILLEKWNESLTVYSLMVAELRIGTRNLASIYLNAFADRMGLTSGKSSTNSMGTLLKSYMIPGCVPFGLREWYLSANSFCLSLRDFKKQSIFIQKNFYISYIPPLFVLKKFA